MMKEFFIEILGFLLPFIAASIILAPLVIMLAKIWWWLAKNAWSIAL